MRNRLRWNRLADRVSPGFEVVSISQAVGLPWHARRYEMRCGRCQRSFFMVFDWRRRFVRLIACPGRCDVPSSISLGLFRHLTEELFSAHASGALGVGNRGRSRMLKHLCRLYTVLWSHVLYDFHAPHCDSGICYAPSKLWPKNAERKQGIAYDRIEFSQDDARLDPDRPIDDPDNFHELFDRLFERFLRDEIKPDGFLAELDHLLIRLENGIFEPPADDLAPASEAVFDGLISKDEAVDHLLTALGVRHSHDLLSTGECVVARLQLPSDRRRLIARAVHTFIVAYPSRAAKSAPTHAEALQDAVNSLRARRAQIDEEYRQYHHAYGN